jgi:hypothetical protein
MGQIHLLEVAGAFDLLGFDFGTRQRGQQHRRQDRDDRDYHQQFDQRETIAWFSIYFHFVHWNITSSNQVGNKKLPAQEFDEPGVRLLF